MLVTVIKARRSALGETHPLTVSAVHSLAKSFRVQGRLEEAKELSGFALEQRERMMQEEPPQTTEKELCEALEEAAHCSEALSQYDEAEALYLECLKKSRSALGKDHPGDPPRRTPSEPPLKRPLFPAPADTLSRQNHLAGLYYTQALYDKAEPLYVSCLKKRRAVLGKNHIDSLRSMNNLAALYRSVPFPQIPPHSSAFLTVSCPRSILLVVDDDDDGAGTRGSMT